MSWINTRGNETHPVALLFQGIIDECPSGAGGAVPFQVDLARTTRVFGVPAALEQFHHRHVLIVVEDRRVYG